MRLTRVIGLAGILITGAGCKARTENSALAGSDSPVLATHLAQCATFNTFELMSDITAGFVLRKLPDGSAYRVYAQPNELPIPIIVERSDGMGAITRIRKFNAPEDVPFRFCASLLDEQITVTINDKKVWEGYDATIKGPGEFSTFQKPANHWTITNYSTSEPVAPAVPLKPIKRVGILTLQSQIVNRILSSFAGRSAVVFDSEGTISSWKLDTLTKAWEAKPLPLVQYWGVAQSVDGKQILGAGNFGGAVLLNGESGAVVKTLLVPTQGAPHWTAAGIDSRGIGITAGSVTKPEPIPYGFDINPSNREVARKEGPKVIRIWNLQTGNVSKTLSFTDSTIREVAIVPDTKFLFAVSYTQAQVWNYETGELIQSFRAKDVDPSINQPLVEGASFSKDLRFLALSFNKDVWILSTETRNVLTKLTGDADSNPKFLRFSDDSRLLHGMNEKGKSTTWRINSGEVELAARAVDWFGLWGIAQMPFAYIQDGKSWLLWRQNVSNNTQSIEHWQVVEQAAQ